MEMDEIPCTRTSIVRVDRYSTQPEKSAPVLEAPPPPPTPPVDWERKREFIIREFISSEDTYSRRLKVTLDLYVNPLRKLDILSNNEINTQFLNWELFVGLHKSLHETMIRDYATNSLNLGARFKTFSHFLKCYSQYLSNYEQARAERGRLLTSNKRFSTFVEKAELDPTSELLPLESYLMEPVQRVPRYRLLLEELLRFTPENHPEHEAVSEALRLTAEVGQSNADAIAERDKRYRIMEIMMQLTPSTRVNLLDDPSRELIKEAILQRQCRRGVKEFYFWLFSDKLLYGDRVSSLSSVPSYSLNRDISLFSCRVRSVQEEKRDAASGSSFNMGTSIDSTAANSTGSDSNGGDGSEWPATATVLDTLKGLGFALGLSSSGRRSSSAGSTSFGGASSGGSSPARRQSAFSTDSDTRDDSSAFIVESPQKSFMAWAPSEAEKTAWVHAIQTAIDSLREKSMRESSSVAPLWTPDTAVSVCQQCGGKFSVVRRKHHCRSCGSNVCAACSLNRCTLPQVDPERDVRVCNSCFLQINKSDTSWTRDSLVDACQICDKAFSLLSRRHHCRGCGVCVCAACSPRRIVLPKVDLKTPLRVCVRCENKA